MRRHAFFMALATLVAAMSAAAPALASTTGGNTATISVVPPPVRSVTVSPATSTYSNCSGGTSTLGALGFPNGSCILSSITVTNGAAAGHMNVNGGDAIPSSPSSPTAHWMLCGGNAVGSPTCTGTSAQPGLDQYSVEIPAAGSGDSNVLLSNTPIADAADFMQGGPAAANQAESTSQIVLSGPQSSTDTSSAFTSTITWTAVP